MKPYSYTTLSGFGADCLSLLQNLIRQHKYDCISTQTFYGANANVGP
jgi:hypothetical protein